MDHKKLREQVNAELGKKGLLGSMVPEEGERVTSGLSSGSMMLNLRLSGSPLIGYAWGRMVELYGHEGGGKTTLALHAVLEAQRLETASGSPVPVNFIDAEHALDPNYAASIGIDMKNLTVTQPDSGEEGLSAVEKSIAAGYKLVVVDSVAALTPQAEIDGEMGDSHMGLQARLMGQACRKLSGKCSKAGAIIIWINQVRMKIGIVFGNPETTPGGRALKFWSSYRLNVSAPRKGKKKGNLARLGYETEAVEVGTTVNVKIPKNKLYPPHRQASFDIIYGEGIDRYKDAIDFLIHAGAFKTGRGGTKVLLLPSKKKSYSPKRVLELFRVDDEVQGDILDVIKQIDAQVEDEDG